MFTDFYVCESGFDCLQWNVEIFVKKFDVFVFNLMKKMCVLNINKKTNRKKISFHYSFKLPSLLRRNQQNEPGQCLNQVFYQRFGI